MSEYSEATESNENGDEMSTIRNFLTTEMRKRALDWLDVAQKVCRENQNVSDCTGCDWWTTCKGSIQTIRKALTDKPDDMNDAIERLNEMGYDTVGVYFTKSKSSWGCCAAGDTEHVDDWIDEDGYPTPREAVMAALAEVEKGE